MWNDWTSKKKEIYQLHRHKRWSQRTLYHGRWTGILQEFLPIFYFLSTRKGGSVFESPFLYYSEYLRALRIANKAMPKPPSPIAVGKRIFGLSSLTPVLTSCSSSYITTF